METDAAAARPSPIWRLAASTVRGVGNYFADRGSQFAAAISYRALFSLIPLLTFTLTVVGVVLRDDERRARVIDAILDRLPLSSEAGLDLERLLTQIPSPWSALGLVSILIVLWSASGVMGSIRIALTVAADPEDEGSFARRKLSDLVLVVAVTVLAILAAALTILSRTFARWTDDLLDWLGASRLQAAVEPLLTGFAIPIVLFFAASVFIYWFLPPRHPPWRYLLPGAVLAAVALQAIQIALAWWLERSAERDALTGVAAGVLGFLFTIYVSATAFLVVGELMYAWAGRPSAQRGPEPSVFERIARRLERRGAAG
jgi:membrane protein